MHKKSVKICLKWKLHRQLQWTAVKTTRITSLKRIKTNLLKLFFLNFLQQFQVLHSVKCIMYPLYKFLCGCIFIASISAFSMGTVEAYPSPALISMENSTTLGYLSPNDETKIAAIALLAALLSGPQIGFLVGKIGRKSVLAISALPFVVGWLLIASTNYFPMIFLGRFITGIFLSILIIPA